VCATKRAIRGSPPGSALPAEFVASHWHGDAFDLPPGALHPLDSDCPPNQAFECGTALGLLCHLEATPQSVAAMAGHGAGEAGGGPCSQTAAEILVAPPERYSALERHLAVLLDRLVD
jgi:GMP synthase-like glutamine amidotransferase